MAGVHVRPGDLLHALGWLSTLACTQMDPEQAGDVLGEDPIAVDDPAGLRTLELGVASCGLEMRWAEHRVCDIGRTRPWMWFGIVSGTRDAMVIFVYAQRWGRHHVRTVHRGVVRERRLRTAALVRLLGADTGSTVLRGLSPMAALPLQSVVDTTDSMSPWRRARALLAIDKADAWLCLVYGIAIGILSLVTPFAVQSLVNTVSFGSVLQPLFVLTVLVAIGLAFAGVMRVLQAFVVEALQQRMFVRSVSDISRRLTSVEVSAYDQLHAPELTHRFFEIPTIQKGIASLYVDGIDLLLKLAVGMPLLAFYHPLLLGFAIALVLGIAFVVFVLGRGGVDTALGESSAKHDAANWLEHIARMPEAFKSASGRRWALERADRIARRYCDARRRHFRRLVHHLVGSIGLKILGATVLLGVGGGLVVQNELTLGQLVAAELVFASIAIALLKLHKQLEAAYDTMTSASKFALLVDLPLERTGGEVLECHGPASVQLRGIELAYAGRDPVLVDVDLVVSPGEHVAVAGGGGSGKSTLLDLLATLRTSTRGVYELDGNDVRLCDLLHLRKDIVLVREPQFVRGSLLTNLRMLRRDADVHEVDEVLEALGLADVAGQLQQGLATELMPSGVPLSRTQARRVALARALIARPRLLLLDGALDDLGLEESQQARLLDYVFRTEAPWTVIAACEDPRVLARCTRRVLLDSGQLGDV